MHVHHVHHSSRARVTVLSLKTSVSLTRNTNVTVAKELYNIYFLKYRNLNTGNFSLTLSIYRLCQWSKEWLLGFNFKKCKIVSYGNCQFEYEYYMIDDQNKYHKLSNEDSECDLGVLFKSNLKFYEHIDNTINKVNRIIGLIKRKFKFIDKDLFLTLYKSLIRSHLDYVNLIFYPTTKKYKQVLGNAQRRATRLVPELRGLSYRERLVELNHSTLDYRRKRFDIIQVFKIIHKIDDIGMNIFFSFAENTQLRGHNLKLKKPRANKSVRANSFTLRNIQCGIVYQQKELIPRQ